MTEEFGLDDARTNGTGEVPDFVAARDHVREELVRFVRVLRRAGVSVPANAGVTAARALVEVGFTDRDRAKTALRACLVTERADIETFEDLFCEFWRRLTAGLDFDGPAEQPADGPEGGLAPLGGETPSGDGSEGADPETTSVDAPGDRGAVVGREVGTDEEGESVTTARYSRTGKRSGVAVPDAAAERFDDAFADLTRALADLPGRRWRAGDGRADVRRALRASLSTGGTVVEVPRRERAQSAVPALVLVDVSRSVLDVIDRSFLLDFLQRARTDWRDARVFFFDEDLREVTRSFDAESRRDALDALERAETEWGGGTHIGGSMARLRRAFPAAVDRRTVALVVSDGLEMGDVSTLEAEVSWLSARARSVLWLNPLATAPEYEPTARGMAAALPYLDGLFAFTDPTDLAEMVRQLRRQGLGGRVGHEYDRRGGGVTRPHRTTNTRDQ